MVPPVEKLLLNNQDIVRRSITSNGRANTTSVHGDNVGASASCSFSNGFPKFAAISHPPSLCLDAYTGAHLSGMAGRSRTGACIDSEACVVKL